MVFFVTGAAVPAYDVQENAAIKKAKDKILINMTHPTVEFTLCNAWNLESGLTGHASCLCGNRFCGSWFTSD